MPFLIFKGKHNSIVCKKLQKLDVMKNKQIYITTNENSWITTELFLEYIENVLDYDSEGKRKLLILDHCTSHDKIEVLNN